MKKYHYTYVLIDINNKLYIGRRSCDCLPKDDAYMGSSTDKNYKPIAKHILSLWSTREEAIAHEIKLHSEFNVGTNKQFANRCNATSAGFDRSGIATTQETRAKLRAINIGKSLTEKTRAKLSAICGAPEMRAKLRDINIGRTHTKETRAKMSATRRGKAIHTAESKIKISVANTGKTHTPEAKLKISATSTGRTLSNEARRKVGMASANRIRTKETREKLKNTRAKNSKVFIWFHSDIGQMTSTVIQLTDRYGLNQKELRKVANFVDWRRQHRGWTCIACLLPQITKCN